MYWFTIALRTETIFYIEIFKYFLQRMKQYTNKIGDMLEKFKQTEYKHWLSIRIFFICIL